MPDDPRPRVLVADASPFARAWTARVLDEAGFGVMAVADGDRALAEAADTTPDALVLSDDMPGLSATGVARALQGSRVDAGTVVVLAGGASEADALRAGIDVVLRTPCTEVTLAQAVTRAVEEGATRRARRERERHNEDELLAAAAIQGALLPPQPEVPAGWTLETGFVPARVVGGDAYDLIVDPGGARMVLVMADVSGKGVAGALLAAMFQTAVRAAVRRGEDPATALAFAGGLLFDNLERTGRFLTATVAEIDLVGGGVAYADAGHGHHVLLGCDGGERPLGVGGPPIGFLPDPDFGTGRESIAPGELLAVFSDGLVEGNDDEDPAEARDRLARSLRAGRHAAALAHEAPDADDRTIVVLRRDP